jgi:hypothetical protein
MSLIKAQKALQVLAEEVALSTADKLAEFLATKIEFDDELREAMDEFKNSVKEEYKAVAKASAKAGKGDGNGEKKKRAPTAYNLFIKDKIISLKAENPSWTGKQLMSAATTAWKAEHPK